MWPTLSNDNCPSSLTSSKEADRDVWLEISKVKSDYEKLKADFDRRELEMKVKQENLRTKLGAMLNLLVIQNQQQNDSTTKVCSMINEITPILTGTIETLHLFLEKVIGKTDDQQLKADFDIIRPTIKLSLSSLNERSGLIIDHQRMSTLMLEKTSDLFRQGVELMSINE